MKHTRRMGTFPWSTTCLEEQPLQSLWSKQTALATASHKLRAGRTLLEGVMQRAGSDTVGPQPYQRRFGRSDASSIQTSASCEEYNLLSHPASTRKYSTDRCLIVIACTYSHNAKRRISSQQSYQQSIHQLQAQSNLPLTHEGHHDLHSFSFRKEDKVIYSKSKALQPWSKILRMSRGTTTFSNPPSLLANKHQLLTWWPLSWSIVISCKDTKPYQAIITISIPEGRGFRVSFDDQIRKKRGKSKIMARTYKWVI